MEIQLKNQELLEMAAKAAGIGPLDFDYAEREGHGLYFGPRLPMPSGVLMAAMYTYWRPLDDDGDALRLAAKLRLTISPGKHQGDGCTVEAPRGIVAGVTAFRDDDSEQMRVAIVHVAAEIGRGMP